HCISAAASDVYKTQAPDTALALTSHLPHAVAAALAATVPPRLLPLSAGAYRDGTRVAASDAALWAGIFLANRQPVLDALATFEGRLAAFRRALEAGDDEVLRAWWSAAARARKSLDDPTTIPHPEPAGPSA
ncbi:MAG: prephenate dehydrogenase/arogenate dehydrogenase family protein, partial [Isosphaeraceae bacterium]|nr:prephenate dehydrogenase/arogenate dehydrogenase family protein [Isosphaeraceae bacterium]